MPDPTRDPVPWELAGGPDECSHGYAAGVPCPRCEEFRAAFDDGQRLAAEFRARTRHTRIITAADLATRSD